MDDASLERDPEKPDGDTPLTREQLGWWEHVLGEEWESEEPGIYRRVERGGQADPPSSNGRA